MEEEKTVWIDQDNRILAFRPIQNGKSVSKEKSLFWDYVMELIKSGYRVM